MYIVYLEEGYRLTEPDSIIFFFSSSLFSSSLWAERTYFQRHTKKRDTFGKNIEEIRGEGEGEPEE